MSKIVDEIAIGRFKENMDSELNKKQNKTLIESVESETKTITVPDGVAGFAAIKMIGGKTIKDGDVLKSAPVESVTISNIITKPEFITITNYAEITNRTGYIYKSLKTGKYNVSVTNAGTKTAFAAVYRNNVRVDEYYIYINSGTTINVIYDIIDGDDIVIYQGSAINSDFITANVVSVGREPYTDTISISDIVKNLPDYGLSAGDIYNYVDFETMIYHYRVGSVDLGSLAWSYNGLNIDKNGFAAKKDDIVIVTNSDTKIRLICSDYDSYSTANMLDKGVIGIAVISNNRFYLSTDKYTKDDATALATSLLGVKAVYELAEEEIIDISDILMPFAVEPNGTIEFVNEHNLDVPNTVLYKKEVL